MEAINSYDDTKGAFSSFSQLVIKRRLLDQLRKNKHLEYELSVEPGAFEGDVNEDEQTSISYELKSKSAEISYINESACDRQSTIKDEIEEIGKELSKYGFSFLDLVKCSPSAGKTKKACAVAIKTIIDSKDLLAKMKHTKSLPMKELVEKTCISRKLLDRYRRYIITAVLILDGDYPLLSEYIGYIKKSFDATNFNNNSFLNKKRKLMTSEELELEQIEREREEVRKMMKKNMALYYRTKSGTTRIVSKIKDDIYNSNNMSKNIILNNYLNNNSTNNINNNHLPNLNKNITNSYTLNFMKEKGINKINDIKKSDKKENPIENNNSKPEQIIEIINTDINPVSVNNKEEDKKDDIIDLNEEKEGFIT